MAYDIDPEVLADIGKGLLPHAELILFDFPSGFWGVWNGAGELNVNGVTYYGAKGLLSLEQLNFGVDLSASPFEARLRAAPEINLTPDVLGTIDDENYKGRPVALSSAYFSRTTGEVVTVLRLWRGYVDKIDHDEQVGGEYALVARLEPRSLDHSRRGWRVRSDTDQRMIASGDRFFEHAATAGTVRLPYGRKDFASKSGFELF